MAETERNNLPVAEEPEFTAEIPAIRPDDPVHFAQMNAMLESLLGNDVFLKRLANKMIENSLIAHVLDCENSQMVLGADQGPAITGLIDGVKEDVTQLYSDISVRYNADTDHIQIHNGIEWIDWLSVGLLFDGYLYNRGIYSEYFTGFTGNATVSNNADNINIKVGPLSGTNYAIVTSNEIDFSKFNKIQINAKSSVYDASSYYTDIQILDKNQNVVAQKRLSNSANTIEIDITNVTNGYIAIKSYLYNITLTFDNIIYSIKLKRTI